MFDFPEMSPTLEFILVPSLIFLSRILDVTLGTLRIIFVSKGMRFLAPLIGFFEVLIWLVVIGQVMQNLDHYINYLAYAGGFAAGNLVGILLEQRLAMGISLLRVITRTRAGQLISHLRDLGFTVTNVPAQTNDGEVEVIFLPIPRKQNAYVIDIVKRFNPKALYTLEEVKSISYGALPLADRSAAGSHAWGTLKNLNPLRRKGK